MMMNLFSVSINYAATITGIYCIMYALGRLCFAFLADKIGLIKTYDIIIGTMMIILIVLPETGSSMDHSSADSLGCSLFSVLICILAFMYGGGKALFYSIVFDVFGSINYKRATGVTFEGFGLSVLIGGISSAYSFTPPSTPDKQTDARTRQITSMWFYLMALGCFLGLFLLHVVTPIDYNKFRLKREKKKKDLENNNKLIEKENDCNLA
jgi:MFS family permease